MEFLRKLTRNRALIVFDALAIIAAYVFVLSIGFSAREGLWYATGGIIYMMCVAIVYWVCLYFAKMYRVMWRYAGTRDYLRLLAALLIATVISIVFAQLIGFDNPMYTSATRGAGKVVHVNLWRLPHYWGRRPIGFTNKTEVLAHAFAIFFIIALRMGVRVFGKMYDAYLTDSNASKNNILIYGAGSTGLMLSRELNANASVNDNIVGYIDDDVSKQNMSFFGKTIFGGIDCIKHVCKKYSVNTIILAMPRLEAARRREILAVCQETKAKVRIVPSIEQILRDGSASNTVRNINIEDLLARDAIKLDNDGITKFVTNKTILVTGGGGSIGSELCRQLMKFKPGKLIILDIYENNAYDLQNELLYQYPNMDLEVLIASVRDIDRLRDIFAEFRPNVVFHAAAHKHVPLMEVSPGEAVKNNVFGTYNVAKCADEFGVERFVMISTDKAVNPTNVMGATKRMCEMVVQSFNPISKTEFVAVRFGNVLGSNGSVIPLFKRQIEKGGPVTVTHKDITRFFMTIPEAAQLVIQAGSFARGGEIFVLDMGQPVKIYDLAENVIRLAGYTPNKDIKIEITGLRPGEKLYEELLMDEEGLKDTVFEKIFIGKQIVITMDELEKNLDILREAVDSEDNEKIKQAVSIVVPTYHMNADDFNKKREEEIKEKNNA